MIALDEGGRQTVSKVGDAANINLDDATLQAMQGAVVTHNHPQSTPRSPADLGVIHPSTAATSSPWEGYGFKVYMHPPGVVWMDQ